MGEVTEYWEMFYPHNPATYSHGKIGAKILELCLGILAGDALLVLRITNLMNNFFNTISQKYNFALKEYFYLISFTLLVVLSMTLLIAMSLQYC